MDDDVLNIRTEIDTEHSFPSYLFTFFYRIRSLVDDMSKSF